MSKKKQKRRNSYKTSVLAFFVLSLFVALHCLVYAIECSAAAKDLDACWETAYSGRCVEFSEFTIMGRNSYTDCYKFKLDNGKVMYETQWNLEKVGFDPERFELLRGEPMDFAYTKLIRPLGRYRALIGIRYQGKDLLSAKTMQKHIWDDANGFYIFASMLLMLSFFALLILHIEPIGRLCKKLKNKRNRKRKQEKKERYYAKQQLNDKKINSSKGD